MSTRMTPFLATAGLVAGLLAGQTFAAAAAGAGEPAAPAPVAAPAVTPAAAAHPDFSGHWKLDPKASDDPAQMGAGRGPGGGAGGGPGGGMGRGGGGRGMGGGPSTDPNRGRMPGEGFDSGEGQGAGRDEAAGRQAAREFGLMEIFHAGDELDLTDGMQISRSLRIGGDPVEVFTPRGSVKAAAAWDGQALVLTESDPRGQVRRTRQLMLSADRSTLTIKEIRHLPGKEGNHVMTMVYRRQDDAPKP